MKSCRMLSAIAVSFCILSAIPSFGDVTFSVLASFAGTNGGTPFAALAQGADGNAYGTTWYGGAFINQSHLGYGTVFKLSAAGDLITIASFDGTNGAFPYSGLAQGRDGNFYGTTYGTGVPGPGRLGSIFKIASNGTLTVLHTFVGGSG